MKSLISKSLLVGATFLLTVSSTTQKSNSPLNSYIHFLEARAKTMLMATPNLTTDQGVANFIRYNYYAVNGAANDFEIQQGLGLLEVVNSILGADGVGGVLGTKGYSSCTSIPASGSSSGSVSGDGQTMTIQLTFGSPVRKVPAHFPKNAGETYDRAVTIDTPMGKYYVELKCSGGSVATAYLYSKVTANGSGETINEAFYQKDNSTNATYLDFYINSVAIGLVDVNRFVTTDGSKFSLYHFTYGSSGGNAFAITGNANSKVNYNTVTVAGLTGDVAPKDIFADLSGSNSGGPQTIKSGCIDMATNTAATACVALDTTADLEIGTTSYEWNFNSMSAFTTSTSPF